MIIKYDKTNSRLTSMNLQERKLFLRSAKWKKFREEVIRKYDGKCCLCHVKTKRPCCHHKDQNKNNYQNLDIENFRLVCPQCHEFLSAMIARKYLPPNLKELIADYIL